MPARRVPAAGKALVNIKIRAGSLEIAHQGEIPEAVAAVIVYALLTGKAPGPETSRATVAQSVVSASKDGA